MRKRIFLDFLRAGFKLENQVWWWTLQVIQTFKMLVNLFGKRRTNNMYVLPVIFYNGLSPPLLGISCWISCVKWVLKSSSTRAHPSRYCSIKWSTIGFYCVCNLYQYWPSSDHGGFLDCSIRSWCWSFVCSARVLQHHSLWLQTSKNLKSCMVHCFGWLKYTRSLSHHVFLICQDSWPTTFLHMDCLAWWYCYYYCYIFKFYTA